MSWDPDALILAPCHAEFGEPVAYTIAGGATLQVTGIFDEGRLEIDSLAAPQINELSPVLGVRTAQFPSNWDARSARGDTFTVARFPGRIYMVRNGAPDSHGSARLEAVRQ